MGKLIFEGNADNVDKNENKGLNWLKEAIKKGHLPALEYKTYWDIRFDRNPKLPQIKENLQKIIEANQSTRACNVLAELNHASAGSELASQNPEYAEVAKQNRENAAKFYLMSAD